MAEFAFPLLAITTFGLAEHNNFMSLPVLVLGLFKFGFPECLSYMYTSLYPPPISSPSCGGMIFHKQWSPQRVGDFLNGSGTILHHSSASLVVCLLLRGVVHPNRHIVDPILVLVAQHWFVMLKYVDRRAYVLVELVLEIWFEWSVISQFEVYVYYFHNSLAMAAGCMLLAHWLYLIAAAIEIFSPPTEERPNKHLVKEIDAVAGCHGGRGGGCAIYYFFKFDLMLVSGDGQ